MAFSQAEKQYYDQLFTVIDKDDAGVLPGQDALPFFVSSGLPQQTLGEIWALADPDNNGFLTREAWYRAARVIGWVQKGQSSVDESLASKPGPLPTFAGQAPPPTQPLSAVNTGAAIPTGVSLPPISPADRTKFTRIFVGCGPSNGLVSGDKARDVFLKSQLPVDTLGQIWNLADTQQRGALDLPDFIIGMHLIQACMANPALSHTLPATLPPSTYEAASGGRAQPRVSSPVPASPIQRQATGSAIQAQRTGQSIISTPTRQASVHFASPPAPSVPPTGFAASRPAAAQQWDVTSDAKATSDRFFATLDTQNRGFIEGDVAVPFMLQSQLDEESLAKVWDLSDIRQEGRLDRNEFAVAMHLINAKLAGQDLPASLPDSLIPPGLRAQYGSGGQEALSQPSASRDLFDLMGDDSTPAPSVQPPGMSSPPTAASPPPVPTPRVPSAQPQPFLPQPPSRPGTDPAFRQLSPMPTGQPTSGLAMQFAQPASDLLGDDLAEAAPASVPDNSAEIGNKQNQLGNTTRAVADLGKTHGELEQQATSSAARLTELEAKLKAAREKHEVETKAVADLRVRVGQQNADLRKLEADVISAESDLTAMKLEKDELEQALLRDKEEVRGLQKMMKDVEEEKAGLKLVLERLKKEARQQKGMVSIAKKQLSTAEGSREAVQAEIRAAEKAQEEFEAVEQVPQSPLPLTIPPTGVQSPPVLAAASNSPVPATPSAISPQPTGASQRSNNPFDRLKGAAPRSVPAVSPPATETPPVTSPAQEGSPIFGTTALAGAGAVVGAAAGAVAAGASSLFHAAKDVVTGEHEDAGEADMTPRLEQAHKAPERDADPFDVPADPFGASPAVEQQPTVSDFDSGFGDDFGSPAATAGGFDEAFTPVAKSAPTDFDSAFADFDDKPEPPSVEHADAQAPQHETPHLSGPPIPSGIPKSLLPELRPEAERTLSTQVVAPESRPETPVEAADAPVPDETPAAPVAPFEAGDAESSDEEEGPEDLDGPKRYQSPPPSAAAATLAPPVAAPTEQPVEAAPEPVEEPKARRSAPPPPPSKTSAPPADESDPFGVPFNPAAGADVATSPAIGSPFGAPSSLPPGAAPAQPGRTPTSAHFDDEDDFDFSDLPPANVDTSAPAPVPAAAAAGSIFDDEFATFDDEFKAPQPTPDAEPEGSDKSKSDNSHPSQTFEMVSPVAQSPAQSHAPQAPGARAYDEWGIATHSGTGDGAAAPASAAQGFSFDDAFGGDFEPAQIEESFAPPAGPPPGASGSKQQQTLAPPVPARRNSEQPQDDDLEDVKKLCAMGFSRTLAVEALDANGYDFQKALNVLLNVK
ncbi:hypothetical protein Q5752_006415 [Cryptotrichosporon argae]